MSLLFAFCELAPAVQELIARTALGAVQFYEKQGFTATGPRQALKGITFLPMHKMLQSQSQSQSQSSSVLQAQMSWFRMMMLIGIMIVIGIEIAIVMKRQEASCSLCLGICFHRRLPRLCPGLRPYAIQSYRQGRRGDLALRELESSELLSSMCSRF